MALEYAAQGPNKDALRGVVSQAPLILLTDRPSQIVVFLASFVYKLLPNVKIYKPIPVISPFTKIIPNCSVGFSRLQRSGDPKGL